MDDYRKPYGVSIVVAERCGFFLGGEGMETVLSKHGEMKGEVREKCERYKCHRVSCKGYKREECVPGGKERFKE